MKNYTHIIIFFLIISFIYGHGQSDDDFYINKNFKNTLFLHKEFISIPNLPENKELMIKNINWVSNQFKKLDFKTTQLPTETIPILLTEKIFNPKFKTVLFYFHIDGQPVNPKVWNQKDPFKPVLKEMDNNGEWKTVDWKKLENNIDDEWRVFARAAADDKAPIIMLLEALRIIKFEKKINPKFNIKVIFDPEEEYDSEAILSTLNKYKELYKSDFFIVMDGPIHNSNKPTITFGCRGIATCSITVFGSKLPQHSGHYGNYVLNPVFNLAKLLSSMKDEQGKVLIQDYYNGISIDSTTNKILEAVPYDSLKLNTKLGIHTAEKVGGNYQESLQYPSLNVRQIGTSWNGKGLKTIIPEYAIAHIDIRLVPETDGKAQLKKIKKHIEKKGYYIIDREPTDEERSLYPKMVKFITSPKVVNSFRTNPNSDFGKKIRMQLKSTFNSPPISVRMMGGTVPIVPLINELNVPTLIIPTVNMDNNQHNPNENIRIGNIRYGIKTCLAILTTDL